jgi:23S rRNA (cytosine1962-C5)-methyltransferase
MHKLILKPGKELSLGKHPWIFSGAIARIEGEPQSGETVQVLSFKENPICLAAYSPKSSIRARVWSYNPEDEIDEKFFRRRIETAVNIRKSITTPADTNAMRLIYSEADLLPGLIADKYDEYIVVQLLSAGVEKWRDVLMNILGETLRPRGIYERSDLEVRKLEGLEQRTGIISGEVPEEKIPIVENNLKFLVDIRAGQKTGFYLDQRINRSRVRQLSEGKRVLDTYCYTGGFSLNALAGGAGSITAIDSSMEALELLEENATLNGFDKKALDIWQGNAFEVLRKFRDEKRNFDLIILDPPKFAPAASALESALRGYKDINLLAMKLLSSGGILVTFSCSGVLNLIRFIEMLGYAAKDAGVNARILEILSQSPDHPISPVFPESSYLKGCIVRIDPD